LIKILKIKENHIAKLLDTRRTLYQQSFFYIKRKDTLLEQHVVLTA